jgi:hypothetical protein
MIRLGESLLPASTQQALAQLAVRQTVFFASHRIVSDEFVQNVNNIRNTSYTKPHRNRKKKPNKQKTHTHTHNDPLTRTQIDLTT